MQTMINVKTDRKLKIEAQKTAKEIGVSLSAVINKYLRDFVMEKQVTFSMPIPNKKTAASLRAADREIRKGKVVGPFSSVGKMIRSLDE